MARRPTSGRGDAVTTEPVTEETGDGEGGGGGGMDLATGLLLACFLSILSGIIFCYVSLSKSYDVGKNPADHYQGKDTDLTRLRKELALGGSGGGGGEAAPAETPAETPAEGESKPAEGESKPEDSGSSD